MKEITLWPLVQSGNDWSVPDKLLIDMWYDFLEPDRYKMTFWDGTVKTAHEWIDYVKSPYNYIVFGVSTGEEKFLGMGWLSNFQHGTAEAHFCYFDKYIPGGGEKIIDFWEKTLPLKVIYGYVPKTHIIALKLLQRWGFKTIGIVPEFCDMAYKNTREGAVVTYRLMEEKDEVPI